MLAIITEFVGTFIFISVVLATGQAVPIAIALASVIYFGGSVSGGHFNPAISTMFLAKGGITMTTWLAYVIAQVLGGLLALMWYKAASAKK